MNFFSLDLGELVAANIDKSGYQVGDTVVVKGRRAVVTKVKPNKTGGQDCDVKYLPFQ